MVGRIKDLCASHGITLNKLEKELSLSKSSVARWDQNSPSIDKVQKVADYFSVSIDFLNGREKTMREILDEDPVTAGVGTLAAHADRTDPFTEAQKREIARIVKDALLLHEREKKRSPKQPAPGR